MKIIIFFLYNCHFNISIDCNALFIALRCVFQFLVKTPSIIANCDAKPSFISPTLPQGSTVSTDGTKAVNISFYATGNTR